MNPYRQQPDKAFWSKVVAQPDGPDLFRLRVPEFPVRPKTKVEAYGSCFARHFGRTLAAKGYT